MIIGKVLGSFLIRNMKVFILDFGNSDYKPSMGGYLHFNNKVFNIKPYGRGKHDFYEEGILKNKDVWSCVLECAYNNDLYIDIPIGTNVNIFSPSAD